MSPATDGRIRLECCPLGSVVAGPGDVTLYEVVAHSPMASSVREVSAAPAQVDFLTHGTERVRFTARRGRAAIRWSGATRVRIEEAGPAFPSPLELLHDEVVHRGIADVVEGLRG